VSRIGSITTAALGLAAGVVWVMRGVNWWISHQVNPKGAAR
jgi:hypothetical protein